MPKVIGQDVDIFAITLGGTDGSPSTGATTSYLGKWESVNITVKKTWSDTTSSDATGPQKRRRLTDFTGSCKGWIDQGGSIALETALQADLITMAFHDKVSGKTVTVRAGIDKAEGTWGADHAKDTLDFIDVGSDNFGGAVTLVYA